MEFFNNTKAVTVRLKSYLGKYLAAGEDAETVRQSSSSASKNVRWTVEAVDGNPNAIRLRSCYGRYLTASDQAFAHGMTAKKVLQTLSERDASTDWELIKEGNRVKLRSKGGKFLRADGWRNSVSHDLPHRTEAQDRIMWHVDVSDEYLPSKASSFSSVQQDDYSLNWPSLPSKSQPAVMPIQRPPETNPAAKQPSPSNLFSHFSGRRDGMEILSTEKAVRLRSHRGTYLAADKDKATVRQSLNGESHKARWTVEFVEGKRNRIRLKSCHGMYLTATDEPFILGMTGRKVLQTLPENKMDVTVEWEPVREGFHVKLMTSDGNFLRADGGAPPWRDSVTHDVMQTTATQSWVLWEVDILDISYPNLGHLPQASSIYSNPEFWGLPMMLGSSDHLSQLQLWDLPMVQYNSKSGNMSMEQNTMIEELVVDSPKHLTDFILFCSMLPSDYEFTRDILVWQWIAGGLTKMTDDEKMENACLERFDTLLSMDYIVPSGYDHLVDQTKYKIGDKMSSFLQEQQLEPTFRKHLDSRQSDVAKVQYLSLAFEQSDGSKVNYLPSDLFLELKDLKILNLSRTGIVALPSSVENLKELQFLDMSETPISWLPETIRCFSSLQTLKLDGCLSLRRLPKCTNELINLRHLFLDVARQLESMPVGIGKLSKLQTLTAYLVGEDDGCRIGELKDMNKLRGSLRIMNLENVETKEEAGEACLFNKLGLKKLELQWSDLQDEKHKNEEDILESLQPPFGIQELKILFYSGGVFPSWISNPLFGELVKIILYRCRYCCILPSLGELPSLKHLTIIENNEVTEIGSSFCRKGVSDHQQRVVFPSLEKLSFDSMSKLEKWTGVEKGNFPSLRHLVIEDCPKFGSLPILLHLTTLLYLEISYCPELSCLPEGALPSTLESLMVKDCPKLAERYCDERREDWPEVARVPGFYINNQKVCSSSRV